MRCVSSGLEERRESSAYRAWSLAREIFARWANIWPRIYARQTHPHWIGSSPRPTPPLLWTSANHSLTQALQRPSPVHLRGSSGCEQPQSLTEAQIKAPNPQASAWDWLLAAIVAGVAGFGNCRCWRPRPLAPQPNALLQEASAAAGGLAGRLSRLVLEVEPHLSQSSVSTKPSKPKAWSLPCGLLTGKISRQRIPGVSLENPRSSSNRAIQLLMGYQHQHFLPCLLVRQCVAQQVSSLLQL